MCSVHCGCTLIFARCCYTKNRFAISTLNTYMYFVDTTVYFTAPMFLWQGWRHDTVHRICPLLLITQLKKFIFRLFLQLFAKLCYPVLSFVSSFYSWEREKFQPILSVFMENVYSKFWVYLRRCSSHSRIVFFPRLCRRDSGQKLNPETPADKGWGGITL